MREDLARKGPDVPDVVRRDIPVRGSTAVAWQTEQDFQSGLVPDRRAWRPIIPRINNFDLILTALIALL